ncbi:MAG: 3-hydroxyacyl-ACP dehydratase FabZ family protein [Caldimonas sp.]
MSPVATRRLEIDAGHPAFDGHFPGRPLLPGVVLLAEVLEAAALEPSLAEAIGRSPQLGVVKFLAPVLPGASLEIAFQLGERSVAFSVSDGGRVAASGQLARADRGTAS